MSTGPSFAHQAPANIGISSSIEIATRAADQFTRLYYSIYDSSTRVDALPNLYRPSSALTWNGEPFQGSEGVRKLMSAMPATKHEIQSFDCHPIPCSFVSLSLSCVLQALSDMYIGQAANHHRFL